MYQAKAGLCQKMSDCILGSVGYGQVPYTHEIYINHLSQFIVIITIISCILDCMVLYV